MDINVSEFPDAWSYDETVRSYWIDESTRKSIFIPYKQIVLTESARTFGIPSQSTSTTGYKVEEIFMDVDKRNTSSTNVSSNIYSDPLLIIYFYSSNINDTVKRSYPTFIATMASIGGIIKIIGLPFGIIYSFYIKRRMRNDFVKNMLMITGKFNMTVDEASEIEEVYDSHYFRIPDEYKCKKHCKKRKKVSPEELEEQKQADFIDNLYSSLLNRQMDLKNYFQLTQDVELIKKILFKKRHLVLRHFVTLESEKRYMEVEQKIKAIEENDLAKASEMYKYSYLSNQNNLEPESQNKTPIKEMMSPGETMGNFNKQDNNNNSDVMKVVMELKEDLRKERELRMKMEERLAKVESGGGIKGDSIGNGGQGT